MPILHVAITGRDRRHLTALGPKLRVVVVGYKESKRGIVVDAYVQSEKVAWLGSRGTASPRWRTWSRTTGSGRRKSRPRPGGGSRRGRYGDVIWSGGYLTADEVERAIEIGATQSRRLLRADPACPI